MLGESGLRGEVIEESIPKTLRQMIEHLLNRLNPEEQRLLEVASVARTEFSAAAVAAGAETTIEEIERYCAALARRGLFLQASGLVEWPDGTTAARYRFLHCLYQQVLYEGMTPNRRSRLHRLIGERKETGYGERAGEIATELAVHFEQGRDFQRAIRYLRLAGDNALRRSAHAEAVAHFDRALTLLKSLPDTPERNQLEIELRLSLDSPLLKIKKHTATSHDS